MIEDLKQFIVNKCKAEIKEDSTALGVRTIYFSKNSINLKLQMDMLTNQVFLGKYSGFDSLYVGILDKKNKALKKAIKKGLK